MSGTLSFACFTEANSAEVVVERMEACRNPRLKEVMTSVVRHLHAVVKEVEPTDAEWMAAIQLRTATGQMSDDRRQEFILLSDTLGVSMLVDSINNRKPSGATKSTVLGSFHVGGAPEKKMGDDICLDGKGMSLVMSGSVRDADGAPVDGAVLDVWMTNDDGFYDVPRPDAHPEMNPCGVFRTGADGRFWFRSVKPRFYPISDDGPVGRLLRATGRHPHRPAHIHFIISAEGFQAVTTHVFVRGDDYLENDAVFGVKESLFLDFVEHADPSRASDLGVEAPFCTAEMDFVLAHA